jgi:hypothetical protein
MTARESDLRGPLAIVVGSEGQGLGPAVRRRADLFMRIPMKGAVGSLNAAVAGSILLFEALAQRDPNATPRVAPALGADAEDEPARPSTKSRAARASRLSTSTAPATASDAQPEASPDADEAAAADTTPKRRARKGLSTEPEEVLAEVADATGAAGPAKPKSKPRAQKAPSTVAQEVAGKPPDDAAAAASVKPTPGRRTRKPPTTEGAGPRPEGAKGSPEDELLPTDGPRKRSPRAR